MIYDLGYILYIYETETFTQWTLVAFTNLVCKSVRKQSLPETVYPPKDMWNNDKKR